jgi:hypothetical protein
MIIITVVENNSAFSYTVIRPRRIFSVVDKELRFDLAECSDYQQGEDLSQTHDIALNNLTHKLHTLDYVWRPLELKTRQDLLSRNIRQLSHHLKHSTAFIKFVTRTLQEPKISEDEQVFCFAMLYNKFHDEYSPRSRQAEDDEFEMDEDEMFRPSQWTAVVASTYSRITNQITKSTMVLKAPDAIQAFTKESLINVLDIAETIGCGRVVVAINKGLLPSTERVQILKAFMYVGFEMVHPSVMSVDNHVLLGYDL